MAAYSTDFQYSQAHLTQDMIISLRTNLTWASSLLLQTVYSNPGIQHKTLCTALSMSTSGLSNLITKIQNIDVPLIHIEKNGRSKYYTLTHIAKQYVEQELAVNNITAKIHTFSPTNYTDSLITEALDNLEIFKKNAGSEWEFLLYNLCNHIQFETADRVKDSYQNFLQSLCTLQVQNKDALHQILDNIGNRALNQHIEKCIDEKLYYFYLLEPLFKVEKNDISAAFKIVDHVFVELYPLNFRFQYNELFSEGKLISDEQYRDIFYCIAKMASEYLTRGYNKSDALSDWQTVYFSNNTSLLYIAEKCSVLSFLMQK